jgi:hypothetical protein
MKEETMNSIMTATQERIKSGRSGGSIETLERYAGTRHEAEAAALVLMHAADYIYEKQDNGNAVDLLDGLRADMGFADYGDRIPADE